MLFLLVLLVRCTFFLELESDLFIDILSRFFNGISVLEVLIVLREI